MGKLTPSFPPPHATRSAKNQFTFGRKSSLLRLVSPMCFLPIRRLVATAFLVLFSITAQATLIHSPIEGPHEVASPTFTNFEARHWILQEGFSHWLAPLSHSFVYQAEEPLSYKGSMKLNTSSFLDALRLSDGDTIYFALNQSDLMSSTGGLFQMQIAAETILLQGEESLRLSLNSLNPTAFEITPVRVPSTGIGPQTSTYMLLVVGLAAVLFFRRRQPAH